MIKFVVILPVVKWLLKIKLYKPKIMTNISWAKVMYTQSFLIIFIYCIVIYALPAIYVYFICMLEIIYDNTLVFISSNSAFGSLKL